MFNWLRSRPLIRVDKDIKDLDLQMKMVENQNEWKRNTIETDTLVQVADQVLSD